MLKKFNQQKLRPRGITPTSVNYDISSTAALLSTSPHKSSIICVPFSVPIAMFHKAGLLVSGQQAIVAAPGAMPILNVLLKQISTCFAPHSNIKIFKL